MTRDEAVNVLKANYPDACYGELREAVDMAIEALRAQDVTDTISRQAAIELIHALYPSAPIMRMNRKRWEEKYKPYIECEKALEQLPSAQPEPSQVARDIATIVENEQDMRVIAQNAQPERKKGYWQVRQRHAHYPDGRPYTDLYCPFCGRTDHNGDGDYCGYCGADLIEGEQK